MSRRISKIFLLVFLWLTQTVFEVYAQHIESLEFRNQSIPDILMVLAEIGETSIVPDETVSGRASFYFSDVDFETALSLFLSSHDLTVRKEEGVLYISRIAIEENQMTGNFSLHAEDIEIVAVIRSLSRFLGITILYDALPEDEITIHGDDFEPEEILNIIIKKYPEYYIEQEKEHFYIKRNTAQGTSFSRGRRGDLFSLKDDYYSADFEQIRFREALTSLFDLAGVEFSMLGRNDSLIERFNFSEKSFDEILRLLMEQGNSDYQVVNNIYYVLDIDRKDILKKLYSTVYMPLKEISVTEVFSLIPASLGSSQNIKADKANNAIILTGSLEELAPIEDFISLIDSRPREMIYHRFQLDHLEASQASSILPKELQFSQPVVLDESNSFIMLMPPALLQDITDYLSIVDVETAGYPLQLRYIKAEDLLKNPPPSVRKEELITTNNPNILYFTGSGSRFESLLDHLELLDRPTPQIRYEVLVMQVQEADKENWDIGFGNSVTEEGAETTLLGILGNVLNLNFDIVSQFGYQFALDLNWSIENSESRVMADTTLNALSGESTRFQNTETYRYQEREIDPDTGEPVNAGVTREITSGLIVEIEGWTSGDGMITMDVKTTISKRDDTSSSNSSSIPTTTERSVNTHIRTESGKPVIIGGLMQQDKIVGMKKTPFLGDIPLLGKLFRSEVISLQDTEMIVTIVPYLEYPDYNRNDLGRDMESLYKRFIRN